ncbi:MULTISPECIES: hypothetical protein [unclassified Rathayibacter]|uniref:hypothetical protein n=1 Tax=unclassified Rathayibacter TaxID=2609250 RepID=UPI000CE83065|nr:MULTISPECIES: hypothetical protein [unclassified Rathayibacter]PPG07101.1 hypothetical protein C5C26_10490 [Rathayibacter sp. AY2B1]PPG73047.1 hypothetical protein C5C59_04130 [Rathayibacter sp. AY1F4]
MRIEYRPHIRYVAASRLKVGDVIIESRDHPAVVTRISRANIYRRATRTIFCRYVWQHPTEKERPLGTFAHDHELRRAI